MNRTLDGLDRGYPERSIGGSDGFRAGGAGEAAPARSGGSPTPGGGCEDGRGEPATGPAWA